MQSWSSKGIQVTTNNYDTGTVRVLVRDSSKPKDIAVQRKQMQTKPGGSC